jgi:hypothetical protein
VGEGDGAGGGDGEGAGAGAPPPDGEGDGRHDAIDNCPTTPNANQHDEDADGRGDVCDNCPATLNANQRDGDADGVGDACDLRPDTPGDAIAFFEPFHGSAAPEWRARFGSFTVENDQLVPQGDTFLVDFERTDFSTTGWVLQVDFVLTRVGATARDIATSASTAVPDDNWLVCALRSTTSSSDVLFYALNGAGEQVFVNPITCPAGTVWDAQANECTGTPVVFRVGDRVTGTLIVEGRVAQCSRGVTLSERTRVWPHPAVFIDDGAAAVRSVVIYTYPLPD